MLISPLYHQTDHTSPTTHANVLHTDPSLDTVPQRTHIRCSCLYSKIKSKCNQIWMLLWNGDAPNTKTKLHPLSQFSLSIKILSLIKVSPQQNTTPLFKWQSRPCRCHEIDIYLMKSTRGVHFTAWHVPTRCTSNYHQIIHSKQDMTSQHVSNCKYYLHMLVIQLCSGEMLVYLAVSDKHVGPVHLGNRPAWTDVSPEWQESIAVCC